MITIFTIKDVYTEKQQKDISEINEEDICYTRSVRPSIMGISDTVVYLGNPANKAKENSDNSKIFKEGGREYETTFSLSAENLIASLVRRLMWEREIKIDISQIIISHAKSLTPEEIGKLIPKLERLAFEKL